MQTCSGIARALVLALLPLVPLMPANAEQLQTGVAAPSEEPYTVDSAPQRPTVLIGLKGAVLLPSAALGPCPAAALELQARSALHDRRLGLILDAGWYRMKGEGAAVDPDIGPYEFSWNAHGLPIHLGMIYEPRLLSFIKGFHPFMEGGAALVLLYSSATLSNESGHVFLRDNPGRGLALGLFAGAGAAISMGPGELLVQARWATAYTDMGYPWLNLDPGDPLGLTIFLGYRLGI